jgi:hypothetical protein
MPETVTDFAALTAQVKALSGDLDRRFEQLTELTASLTQLSSRIEHLSGRLDTVSIEVTSLPFVAALGDNGAPEDWVGGTLSPEVSVSFDSAGGTPRSIANGQMTLQLPNGARIRGFRASVRVDLGRPGALSVPAKACELIIKLRRVRLEVDHVEDGLPAVEVSLPSFAGGSSVLRGIAVPDREVVDNTLFESIITADFRVRPFDPAPPIVIPQGFVVLDSFHIDCVLA